MANPEHLKIIRNRDDLTVWNKHESKKPKVALDLSGADLRDVYLGELDLSGANFSKATLIDVSFLDANLTEANFRGANLQGVHFFSTNLTDAILRDAQLEFANIDSGSNLLCADLTKAKLYHTRFHQVFLGGADFTKSEMGSTAITDVDLSKVKGLDSVSHSAPSSIGVDTLYKSRGKISDKFLRDAGVPEGLISYLPSLIEAVQPFQWYSCFISYSTKNQNFAERLHSRMRQAGLRVWFDREDMKGGDYLHTQIDRAIQLHDRLLLVLSEESIQSKWVEREIKRTRKIERAEKRRKLFPIRLVDMQTLREWECLDSDTGEDLAEEVRKYHIPDFSNWKNHDAFETAFARLEKDLRSSVGNKRQD